MAYMLLCVLPKEIVEIIYHFNNSEYAFIYFTKFTLDNKYGKINSVFYQRDHGHNLNELYEKHMKIEYISRYLTSMLECNFYYSREKLQPILNYISKHLMHRYNILYVKNSLKKKNTNYEYLEASIKLWFKLCQKYNLYLLLCLINDGKKHIKIFNSNKINGLETFSQFAISPILLLDKVYNKDYHDKEITLSLFNHKMVDDRFFERINKFGII
jgi:hypothetical protein